MMVTGIPGKDARGRETKDGIESAEFSENNENNGENNPNTENNQTDNDSSTPQPIETVQAELQREFERLTRKIESIEKRMKKIEDTSVPEFEKEMAGMDRVLANEELLIRWKEAQNARLANQNSNQLLDLSSGEARNSNSLDNNAGDAVNNNNLGNNSFDPSSSIESWRPANILNSRIMHAPIAVADWEAPDQKVWMCQDLELYMENPDCILEDFEEFSKTGRMTYGLDDENDDDGNLNNRNSNANNTSGLLDVSGLGANNNSEDGNDNGAGGSHSGTGSNSSGSGSNRSRIWVSPQDALDRFGNHLYLPVDGNKRAKTPECIIPMPQVVTVPIAPPPKVLVIFTFICGQQTTWAVRRHAGMIISIHF
jgi:hypothetical protein